jgi:hypothetical protein
MILFLTQDNTLSLHPNSAGGTLLLGYHSPPWSTPDLSMEGPSSMLK